MLEGTKKKYKDLNQKMVNLQGTQTYLNQRNLIANGLVSH